MSELTLPRYAPSLPPAFCFAALIFRHEADAFSPADDFRHFHRTPFTPPPFSLALAFLRHFLMAAISVAIEAADASSAASYRHTFFRHAHSMSPPSGAASSTPEEETLIIFAFLRREPRSPPGFLSPALSRRHFAADDVTSFTLPEPYAERRCLLPCAAAAHSSRLRARAPMPPSSRRLFRRALSRGFSLFAIFLSAAAARAAARSDSRRQRYARRRRTPRFFQLIATNIDMSPMLIFSIISSLLHHECRAASLQPPAKDAAVLPSYFAIDAPLPMLPPLRLLTRCLFTRCFDKQTQMKGR